MLRRSLVALPLLAVAAGTPAQGPPRRGAPDPARPYAGRPEIAAFADEVAARRTLPRAWVEAQLARARLVPAVQRLIMPPPSRNGTATAKNWTAYRDRFVERARIAAGLDFWRAQEDWLRRADWRFGVPPEIVVAVVGVETFFGRITGGFRVIDALATLAFDFPPGRRDRRAFFRAELEEFLAWCAREGLDPQEPLGSYAGAIGLAQFMPSSINRYGIDFDDDGQVDLRTNAADVVGSVAHYLAEFGWLRGMPTHFEVQPPPEAAARATLLAPDIVPSFTPEEFAARGARLDAAGSAFNGPLALVELENGGAPPAYFAGTTNFYAVTRYNWSSYYAMAVILLAEALRAAA
jgi:membrane-bound lytic murein transglycosylase B